MKIAFVANTSWNIYNFRKGLVKNFLAKGREVIVFTPNDRYTQNLIDWGVKWIETPLNGTGVNPLQDLQYLWHLRAHFKKERPDVVLSYTIKSNIYSCLAATFLPTPVVCNVSGLGTVFLVSGVTGKIAMLLYKVAFRRAAHVFFQNEDDKALFTSKIFLPAAKIGTLPGSGIDLNEFQYAMPLLAKPIKALMVSRLIIEKGVREYAEAASFFVNDPEVDFTLVGRFDETHSRSIEKNELDNWVNKGWITYTPHTDGIKEMIKEHELIVLPSYREGTPRTLLEGAAMGRALLAANVPGCKEVVNDGENGFLFEVKDAKSLADKIRSYISLTNEEKQSFSKASRKLVEEKYDESIIIACYDEVIHRLSSLS